MIKILVFLAFLSLPIQGYSQVLFQESWQNAGTNADSYNPTHQVNVTNYGAVGDSVTDCRTAFSNAINALNNQGGIVYVPEGKFRLTGGINLPEGVILRGKNNKETSLIFDFGSSGNNGISVNGSKINQHFPFVESAVRGTNKIVVSGTVTSLNIGDYLLLTQENVWETIPATDWAKRSPGQLVKIRYINKNEIFLQEPLNVTLEVNLQASAQLVRPRQYVGIENIRLRRMANATGVPNNISFNMATNCWVKGVESHFSASSHIMVAQSSHILIRGNYIHDGFVFDGTGTRGYGVTFIQQSTNCLVEDNIFRKLRHAITCKEGANGNVIAYNYCFEPFRTEFPADGGADCLLHGYWPTANLYEGNIGQFFQASAFWGPAGPHNTIFRNRFLNYGILGSEVTNGTSLQQTDSTNVWCNESTNTSTFMGFPKGVTLWFSNYSSLIANHANGTLQNANQPLPNILNSVSLYLKQRPSWWPSNIPFGKIGWPETVNSGTNPAFERWQNSALNKVVLVTPINQANQHHRVFTSAQIRGKCKAVTVFEKGILNLIGEVEIDSAFTIKSGGVCIFNTFQVKGNAKLTIEDGATIVVNNPSGLNHIGVSRNIITNQPPNISTKSNWCFSAKTNQVTGSLVPSEVSNLIINNPQVVELSNNINVSGQFILHQGTLKQTINGSLNLLSTASIPVTGNNVNLENGHLTTIQRQWQNGLRSMRGSWVFLSPLVERQTVGSWAQNNPFAPNTFKPDGTGSVFGYNPNLPNSGAVNNHGYFKPDSLNQILPLGTGYRVWVNPIKTNSLYQIKGTPKIGTLTIPLSYCAVGCVFTNPNGWNFLGNPYLSPISWDKITDKQAVAPAIYTWDWAMKRWKVYLNGVGTFGFRGIINPSEGFMVIATAANAYIKLEEKIKVLDNPSPFSTEERPLKIIFSLSKDSTQTELIAYHHPEATKQFSAQFDAPSQGEQLAVFESEDTKPILIKAYSTELDFTIKVNQESNLKIEGLPTLPPKKSYYVSLLSNGNLIKEIKNYELKSEVLINNLIAGKYRLSTAEEGLSFAKSESNFVIFPNPFSDIINLLHINEGQEIKIFDAIGKIVFSVSSEGVTTINTSGWPKGVYFLNSGNQTKKLVKQ